MPIFSPKNVNSVNTTIYYGQKSLYDALTIFTNKIAMVFFYVHLDVLVATWSLPSATKIKFHKKVYNDFPGRYLQLPGNPKNVKISESVYQVASYL